MSYSLSALHSHPLSAQCTLQDMWLKWPPSLYMFLQITSSNDQFSQHQTACHSNSNEAPKGIKQLTFPTKIPYVFVSPTQATYPTDTAPHCCPICMHYHSGTKQHYVLMKLYEYHFTLIMYLLPQNCSKLRTFSRRFQTNIQEIINTYATLETTYLCIKL
jgi:hypothetical protein